MKNIGNIDGATGSTEISGGSTLIASHIHQPILTINDTSVVQLRAGLGNGSTSLFSELPTIASGGMFDLNDARVVIQFDNNPIPLSATRAAIIAGRGGTGFAHAPWNGTGGISSFKASIAGGGDGVSFAIGYVPNSALPTLGLPTYGTFGGQVVDSGSLLIRYTLGADANLDGIVNGDDVTVVGADLNAGGTGDWFLGDFDYDGICDGDDVTVLGALYNPTAPPLSANQLTAQFGSEFAAAFERGRAIAASRAAVPEPSTITLLGMTSISLLRRRRRSR